MIVSALFALAVANVVRAQVSTASLFPVGFQGDGLEGEAVGTGADGTTYVLSGTFDTLGIPFTMTLVQDATHVSEGAVIATEQVSFFVDVQCGISNGQAICTESVSEGSTATVITESGAVVLVPVPLGAGSATGSASAVSGSTTGASSSATPSITFSSGSAASSSSNSLSLIPASISVTSRTSATLTTPTAATPSSTIPITSGAMKNAFVGLGLTLPVLSVLLNSF